MIVQQVLQQLTGRPDLFGARKRGLIIQVTDRLAIRDVRSGAPRPFAPSYADLVSDDWAVMTTEQLRQAFPEMFTEQAV